MASLIRAIRNAPPEYPWERSAREELINRIDLRWRAYCLLQATAISVGAVATLIAPGYFYESTATQRRSSIKTNSETIRDYLGMAAKR